MDYRGILKKGCTRMGVVFLTMWCCCCCVLSVTALFAMPLYLDRYFIVCNAVQEGIVQNMSSSGLVCNVVVSMKKGWTAYIVTSFDTCAATFVQPGSVVNVTYNHVQESKSSCLKLVTSAADFPSQTHSQQLNIILVFSTSLIMMGLMIMGIACRYTAPHTDVANEETLVVIHRSEKPFREMKSSRLMHTLTPTQTWTPRISYEHRNFKKPDIEGRVSYGGSVPTAHFFGQ